MTCSINNCILWYLNNTHKKLSCGTSLIFRYTVVVCNLSKVTPMWQPKMWPRVRRTLLSSFTLASLVTDDNLEVAAWNSLVVVTSYLEIRVNIWPVYLGQALAAATPRATSFKCSVAAFYTNCSNAFDCSKDLY